MIKTRIITIETMPMEFPAGTQEGPWDVRITGTTSETRQIAGTTAEFALPVGDYTVTAQRLDANGNALGPQVSATFTVAEEIAVRIDVAAGIQITLGQ